MNDKISNFLADWRFRIVAYITLSFFIIYPYYRLITSSIVQISPELIYFSIFLVSLVPIIIIESMRKGGSLALFGFAFNKFTPDQIVDGAVYAIISIGAIALIGYPLGIISLNQFCPISLFGTLVITFVFAGFEEIGFRGYIFQTVYERFGDGIAIFLSGTVFGLAHLWNANFTIMAFINTALVGYILAGFWTISKTLWTPFIFHFVWNFLNYHIVNLKVNAIAGNSFLEFLFGKNYGIEEGFLATLSLLFVGLYFLKSAKTSPNLTAICFKRKYEESELKNG